MDEIEDTQVGRYTISITHIRTILDSQCNKRSPSDHSSCPRVEMTDRIISASIPPTHSATVINGHTDAIHVSPQTNKTHLDLPRSKVMAFPGPLVAQRVNK